MKMLKLVPKCWDNLKSIYEYKWMAQIIFGNFYKPVLRNKLLVDIFAQCAGGHHLPTKKEYRKVILY